MTAVAAKLKRLLAGLPDWRAVGTGLAAGLLANAVGIGELSSVLVGLAVAVAGVVVLALDAGEGYQWPPDDLAQTDGARREISSLTWSFVGRDGRVSENAVKHLQEVASRRLARHGAVVPGGLRNLPHTQALADDAAAVLRSDGSPDPAAVAHAAAVRAAGARAEELLGPRAWRCLAGRSGWLPSLSDVAHCIDVLEGMGRDQPTPTSSSASAHAPAPETTS